MYESQKYFQYGAQVQIEINGCSSLDLSKIEICFAACSNEIEGKWRYAGPCGTSLLTSVAFDLAVPTRMDCVQFDKKDSIYFNKWSLMQSACNFFGSFGSSLCRRLCRNR